ERAVALRPEMTPSLARLVGAKAKSLKRPVKWFSIGEQFRYERPQKGRLRSFYQYNVDILGEPGIGADAELIACLVQTLKAFDLDSNDFKVRLSDRQLWILFLKHWNVSDEHMTAVLSIMDRLGRLNKDQLKTQLNEYFGGTTDSFINSVDELMGIDTESDLMNFFSKLELSDTVKQSIEERLAELTSLIQLIDSMEIGHFVSIDFSIVRGLAYYTGFVFEAFEATGEGRALAGGGRYDDLIARLTSNSMEAVGFAMGDVTLLDLLESKGKLPEFSQKPDIMLLFTEDAARSCALADAQILRSAGLKVDYPLKRANFSKLFKEANLRGVPYVLIYGNEEIQKGLVKLKDFQTGEESFIERSETALLEKLKTLL
ncbi:MAG: ATP phosphoribosyltransferase regulatory subunit, partial [Verrucomicrobia bacterium]|nr:ATP phosphoribosyltransferase regulatory subunit [Verrucomicrobiota bacterium]